MQGIPIEYQPKIMQKMANYSIEIEGAEAKVEVVDIHFPSLLETHINVMKMVLKTSPRVVGFDTKYMNDGVFRGIGHLGGIGDALVLCGGAANYLIILLPDERNTRNLKIPQVLIDFLSDPKICFVGATDRQPAALMTKFGVKAGDLAAMVLQNTTIVRNNIEDVMRRVGIPGDGLSFGIKGVKIKMLDPNHILMSPDQVKLAVSDAYAAYQIGHSLLKSL